MRRTRFDAIKDNDGAIGADHVVTSEQACHPYLVGPHGRDKEDQDKARDALDVVALPHLCRVAKKDFISDTAADQASRNVTSNDDGDRQTHGRKIYDSH